MERLSPDRKTVKIQTSRLQSRIYTASMAFVRRLWSDGEMDPMVVAAALRSTAVELVADAERVVAVSEGLVEQGRLIQRRVGVARDALTGAAGHVDGR